LTALLFANNLNPTLRKLRSIVRLKKEDHIAGDKPEEIERCRNAHAEVPGYAELLAQTASSVIHSEEENEHFITILEKFGTSQPRMESGRVQISPDSEVRKHCFILTS
jgi:hypothetical protein